MTLPSHERCDAGLSNDKRCQNRAQFWIVFRVDLTNNREPEEWPVAVCEAHKDPQGPGFFRLGPDRREEYASRERRDSPAPDPA